MVRTSAAVAGGIVYVDTASYNASTGTPIAGFYINGENYLSSAVVDGLLYVAASNGTFYALGEPSTNGIAFSAQTLLIALLASIVTVVLAILFFAKYKNKKIECTHIQ
jgi:uncharacterized membrane protein